MPAKVKIPQWGVEFCVGLPGAGKSYFGTKRALTAVIEQRRPVFTNLPIKWRAMRHYLKRRHGPEVADLVFQLTEDHWRRFLNRQRIKAEIRGRLRNGKPGQPLDLTPDERDALEAYNRGRERLDLLDLDTRHTISTDELEHLYRLTTGEDILRGPEANWIPPSSIVCIDEVHDWHPMQTQNAETLDLLDYLTKLRHHTHYLWCMTQDEMQVNKRFRDLAKYYWRITNAADEKILWGLRLAMFGVVAFNYEKLAPAQYYNRQGTDPTPIESYTVYPQMPRNRYVFRLYNSFTHMGSPRRMNKSLEETRQLIGLDPTGRSDHERQQEEERRARPKLPMIRKAINIVFKTVLLITLLLATALVSYAIGTTNHEQPEPEPQVIAPGYTAPEQWGTWTGVGMHSAFIDGRRYTTGDTLPNGAQITALSSTGMVLDHAGHYWLWSINDASPFHLGDRREIEDKYSAASSGEGPPLDGLP